MKNQSLKHFETTSQHLSQLKSPMWSFLALNKNEELRLAKLVFPSSNSKRFCWDLRVNLIVSSADPVHSSCPGWSTIWSSTAWNSPDKNAAVSNTTICRTGICCKSRSKSLLLQIRQPFCCIFIWKSSNKKRRWPNLSARNCDFGVKQTFNLLGGRATPISPDQRGSGGRTAWRFGLVETSSCPVRSPSFPSEALHLSSTYKSLIKQ